MITRPRKIKISTKQNGAAMTYIVKVMTTRRVMRIINKEKHYWTYGLDHMGVDYLEKKMNPYKTMAMVKFITTFQKVSINNNDDPTNLFQQISA